jgi:hypothetical protein
VGWGSTFLGQGQRGQKLSGGGPPPPYDMNAVKPQVGNFCRPIMLVLPNSMKVVQYLFSTYFQNPFNEISNCCARVVVGANYSSRHYLLLAWKLYIYYLSILNHYSLEGGRPADR